MAPGAPVFGQDMNVNVPFLADIVAVLMNWQLQTDAHLMHKSQWHIWCEHTDGNKICINNHYLSADNLSPAWVGSFSILHAHANGTVTVQQGQTHKPMSIFCIKPTKGLQFHISHRMVWSGHVMRCQAGVGFIGMVFLSSVAE